MECRSSVRRETQKEKIAHIIYELRIKYPLDILLQVSGMKQSTYYYTISKSNKDEKNDELMNGIIDIFYEHKERYGYRRITLELKNRGIKVNHKKVQRLMNIMGLYSKIRKKRKYSSYKGTVGKIADNLIERNFEAAEPNKKWYTDVTEFNLRGQKLYLSTILDGFNSEVVSFSISTSPNLKQVDVMLERALRKNRSVEHLIFHSDQGWQYQHSHYIKKLKDNKIKQSMSRKGNSMDNGMMESFFGILKSEMFYAEEHTFKNLHELEIAISEYIEYYNVKRIKTKLKGLSPVSYRNQVLQLYR